MAPDIRRAAPGGPPVASFHRLTEAVLAAVWEQEPAADNEHARPPSPRRADGSELTPHASLKLPTLDGRERVLVLLRCSPPEFEDPEALTFMGADDTVLARGAAALPESEVFAERLSSGLTARGQFQLLRGILLQVRPILRLSFEPAFVQLCVSLIQRLTPAPQALGTVINLTDRLVLAVEPFPTSIIGQPLEIAVAAPNAVRVSRVRPARKGSQDSMTCHAIVERDFVEVGNLLVIIGRNGILVRRVDRGARNAPEVMPWTGQLGSNASRFVSRIAPALAAAAPKEPALRPVLWEMQVRFPWERRRAIATGGPISADLDLTIGHGAGGLFLAGWLDDPYDMIESLSARSVLGTERQLDQPLYRLPHEGAEKNTQQRLPLGNQGNAGFVTYLPGEPDPVPSLQHRIELRLTSGTRIGLVAPLPPARFADALGAVLSSVPSRHLTPDMLEHCIGPAAAHLHAAHMNSTRVADVVTMGEPPRRPQISVVIPLFRNLEFLRFQLGAFGTDPEFRDAELIYVLDSPEQRQDVSELLEGQHLLHGLPLKLVVMRDNFGFAAASNAGAEAARSETLLMLNSDIIPVGPGWLGALRAALNAQPALGAVGPKLLFEDGSLQHAGMYFDTDHKGRWLNHHYYKGMPRAFSPANIQRSVPGVTGACLMLSAELFHSLGGFSEDYIYGDFEDSDLCLKIRRSGRDIQYAPSVELYHLEWRSKAQHRNYRRGVANEYNSWLQSQRWGDEMATLMGQFEPGHDKTAPVPAEDKHIAPEVDASATTRTLGKRRARVTKKSPDGRAPAQRKSKTTVS